MYVFDALSWPQKLKALGQCIACNMIIYWAVLTLVQAFLAPS